MFCLCLVLAYEKRGIGSRLFYQLNQKKMGLKIHTFAFEQQWKEAVVCHGHTMAIYTVLSGGERVDYMRWWGWLKPMGYHWESEMIA